MVSFLFGLRGAGERIRGAVDVGQPDGLVRVVGNRRADLVAVFAGVEDGLPIDAGADGLNDASFGEVGSEVVDDGGGEWHGLAQGFFCHVPGVGVLFRVMCRVLAF